MRTKTILLAALAVVFGHQVNAQTAEGYTSSSIFEFNDIDKPEWAPNFIDNNMRGIVYLNGELLIPARGLGEGNGVVRLNAATGEFIGMLNMSGVEGGTFPINDIALSEDGAIYAANMTTDARNKKWDKENSQWVDHAGNGPFKVYKWTDVNAAPETILAFFANEQPNTESTAKNNAFRMGDAFTFHGTSQNGKFITGIDNLRERAYEWTITDGVVDPNPACLAFLNGFTTDFDPITEEEVEVELPLNPRFGGYGRFYQGFDENTIIERSKDEADLLRVFRYDRTATNGWKQFVLDQEVQLNSGRIGSSNSALPFTCSGKRFIAAIDFEGNGQSVPKGLSGQAVVYDVTDWTAPVEVFRSATVGEGDYKNGTAAVAVKTDENGFDAYFLSVYGLQAYRINMSNTAVGRPEAEEWAVSVDRASQTISFPAAVSGVRVFQAQTGIEVLQAVNVNELHLSSKGAYILSVALDKGETVNCKVIL